MPTLQLELIELKNEQNVFRIHIFRKRFTSNMTNLVSPLLRNDPRMWWNWEAAGTRCIVSLPNESFITLDAAERRSRTNNKDIYFEGCTGESLPPCRSRYCVVRKASPTLLWRLLTALSSGQQSSHRLRRFAIRLCSLEAVQSARDSCCAQVQNVFKRNFQGVRRRYLRRSVFMGDFWKWSVLGKIRVKEVSKHSLAGGGFFLERCTWKMIRV